MTTNGQATNVDVTEATGPQMQAATPAKQLTREEWLTIQARRVEELGVRVGSLINTTADTFQAFVEAQQLFFVALAQPPAEEAPKETNDNQSTDSATEASA